MSNGTINKIIPFSSVDGPGNRTSIFLQGCNFNCLYCHNPETINTCKQCGTCVSHCPTGALSFINNKVVWNHELCVKCDECLKSCAYNSSPKTLNMDVKDVIERLQKVRPFIEGITISGGECTLQREFIIDLFKEAKKLGLSCFVDTNGSTPLYKDKDLLKVMDKAMIDFKCYDSKAHKTLTSMDNSTVVENIKVLSSMDKIYEIRTVIVPEVLDNEYNVDNISKLIASLNPNIIYKIIKYRPLGVRESMIKSYTPSQELMEKLYNIAKSNGCKNIICV